MTNQESTYEKNDIIVKLIHDNIKSVNSFTQIVRYMKNHFFCSSKIQNYFKIYWYIETRDVQQFRLFSNLEF